MIFSFNDSDDGIRVTSDCLYEKTRGYGLITDKSNETPGLSNHFTVPSYYEDEKVIELFENTNGVTVDCEETCKRISAAEKALIPVCFKADVPEYGNYIVSCTVTGKGEVIVFTQSRRLAARILLGEDEKRKLSFTVNVSRIIPRGSTEPSDRKSVYVSILGSDVTLCGIEIEKSACPTVYICGDSTVTDQPADFPYSPGSSYSGWGQMLSDNMHGIGVSNHAHSGLTTESFRNAGHYGIVEEIIRPGDYIMFQFAHNDQKLEHLKAYGGYKERLIAYINEARSYGAFPIIVTPLARNTWKADTGTYNDLLWEYAKVCIELGSEYNVPVVDLHEFSMNEVLRDGLESSKRFYFPKDYTHTNDYGAYKMAGFIAGELKKLTGEYKILADSVTVDTLEWNVTGIPCVPEIPEKYRTVEKHDDTGLFAGLERPDELLTRVEALDMVIKTARFFPTNVFNDIYDDIVGHEWYAGTVECAYQNGIIPSGMIKDKMFRPTDNVTLEDFICFIIGGYKSRKPMPPDVPSTYDVMCNDYSATFVRAAVKLGVLEENKKLREPITRQSAARICTMLNI